MTAAGLFRSENALTWEPKLEAVLAPADLQRCLLPLTVPATAHVLPAASLSALSLQSPDPLRLSTPGIAMVTPALLLVGAGLLSLLYSLLTRKDLGL